MSHKWKFTAIIAVQVAALILMIGYKQYALTEGKMVLLKALPVDPRSLMSGDYVALRYEISSLDAPFTRPGATVYALVRPGAEGLYNPAGFSWTSPAQSGDIVALKGKVVMAWGQPVARYGIETFYVPEGRGREIERKTREGSVIAVVRVLPDGAASLEGLRVDGKPFK